MEVEIRPQMRSTASDRRIISILHFSPRPPIDYSCLTKCKKRMAGKQNFWGLPQPIEKYWLWHKCDPVFLLNLECMFITFDIIGITLFFIYAYFICSKINSNTFLENYGRFHLTLMFCCIRDGLHLTTEGNAVVYEELIKVFDEAGTN